MKSNFTISGIKRAVVLGAMMVASTAAFAQVNGAIYTTKVAGDPPVVSSVDANIYANMTDVYLNGGPGPKPNDPCPSSNLTPGNYFFEVRVPGSTGNYGNLLSTDIALSRQFTVGANGRVQGYVGPHAFVSYCGGQAIQLSPYAETTNAGGEYTVVVILNTTKKNGQPSVSVDPFDATKLIYTNNYTKHDNFKVKPAVCTIDCVPQTPPPSFWPLEGRKFYDTNGNGFKETAEPWLDGFAMRGIGDSPMQTPSAPTANYIVGGNPYYSFVVYTHNGGKFEFSELTKGGIYGVAEIMPSSKWFGTANRALGPGALLAPPAGPLPIDGYNGGKTWESNIFCPRHINATESINVALNSLSCLVSLNAPGTSSETLSLSPFFNNASGVSANIVPGRGPVDFGNACIGTSGGLTLGFWSNKNGAKLETAARLATLAGLNLKNADGTDFNPTTAAQLSTWLLNGNAVNMANMLSVQLAAMELNVMTGGVDGTLSIYAPGTGIENANGYATVNDLMAAANASLGLYPITLSGHAQRATQEAMKTALDRGNNNLEVYIQKPGVCQIPAVYDEIVPDTTDAGNVVGAIQTLTGALGGRTVIVP